VCSSRAVRKQLLASKLPVMAVDSNFSNHSEAGFMYRTDIHSVHFDQMALDSGTARDSRINYIIIINTGWTEECN